MTYRSPGHLSYQYLAAIVETFIHTWELSLPPCMWFHLQGALTRIFHAFIHFSFLKIPKFSDAKLVSQWDLYQGFQTLHFTRSSGRSRRIAVRLNWKRQAFQLKDNNWLLLFPTNLTVMTRVSSFKEKDAITIRNRSFSFCCAWTWNGRTTQLPSTTQRLEP